MKWKPPVLILGICFDFDFSFANNLTDRTAPLSSHSHSAPSTIKYRFMPWRTHDFSRQDVPKQNLVTIWMVNLRIVYCLVVFGASQWGTSVPQPLSQPNLHVVVDAEFSYEEVSKQNLSRVWMIRLKRVTVQRPCGTVFKNFLRFFIWMFCNLDL